HRTFRTAAVEPKVAALEYVLANRRQSAQTDIVCHEWWNYWPIAYLAGNKDNVRVWTSTEWEEAPHDGRSEDTWFVEFAGSTGEYLARLAFEGPPRDVRYTVSDYGGRPIISVIGPAEKFSQNY